MTASTYIDRHVDDQECVISTMGNWAWCYRDQAAILESLLRPGMTVLDVGCGSSAWYGSRGARVIGLDPSAESLARNIDVDERICASATSIPLPDASVDLVVALYAVHHCTTQTYGGCRLRAERVLREMQRVVKPNGDILVFEMRPHPWAATLQRWCWDFAKALLGARLDSCFWADDLYPSHATVQTFAAPWYTLIAPIVSLPWLKIPRILWPFTPILYRWSPGGPC